MNYYYTQITIDSDAKKIKRFQTALDFLGSNEFQIISTLTPSFESEEKITILIGHEETVSHFKRIKALADAILETYKMVYETERTDHELSVTNDLVTFNRHKRFQFKELSEMMGGGAYE